MAGSAAEERIRAKVVAALRSAYPDARIVHELMLAQGGCRIDLAAITPSRLIVAEIKSEADVLDRLERQVAEAGYVADGVAVIVAEKHLNKAQAVRGVINCWSEDAIRFTGGYGYFERQIMAAATNAPARLAMLWAAELRIIAGGKPKAARRTSIVRASNTMTGAEVRRAVCAALRARIFARADTPILSDLFPVSLKGAL